MKTIKLVFFFFLCFKRKKKVWILFCPEQKKKQRFCFFVKFLPIANTRALTSIELSEAKGSQISKKNPERHDSLLEHQKRLFSTKTVFCRGLGTQRSSRAWADPFYLLKILVVSATNSRNRTLLRKRIETVHLMQMGFVFRIVKSNATIF